MDANGGGEVVGERVEPDVDDVVGIAGDRHAPRAAVDERAAAHQAGDGEVLEALPERGEHLAAPRRRDDELGVRFDVPQQAVGVPREREEVVLLLEPVGLERGVVRAGALGGEVFGAVEGVAVGAVVAGVDGLVDVAGSLRAPEQLLRRPEVDRLGGANPAVVRAVELAPGEAERLVHLVDP
jgi:hypothetical protein